MVRILIGGELRASTASVEQHRGGGREKDCTRHMRLGTFLPGVCVSARTAPFRTRSLRSALLTNRLGIPTVPLRGLRRAHVPCSAHVPTAAVRAEALLPAQSSGTLTLTTKLRRAPRPVHRRTALRARGGLRSPRWACPRCLRSARPPPRSGRSPRAGSASRRHGDG